MPELELRATEVAQVAEAEHRAAAALLVGVGEAAVFAAILVPAPSVRVRARRASIDARGGDGGSHGAEAGHTRLNPATPPMTGRSISIRALSPTSPKHIEQVAAILLDAFRGRSAAWPDMDAARGEVLESLEPERVSRIAIDDVGDVLGWIGGQPQYDGLVWELHPLVVAAHARGRGIGRALVEDLETLVAERGALTLWLGSDDEIGETSLGGIDLYDDLPAKLASFSGGGDHPAEFYRRLGFGLVGVMPDANGRGKPDIYFAKRIAK